MAEQPIGRCVQTGSSEGGDHVLRDGAGVQACAFALLRDRIFEPILAPADSGPCVQNLVGNGRHVLLHARIGRVDRPGAGIDGRPPVRRCPQRIRRIRAGRKPGAVGEIVEAAVVRREADLTPGRGRAEIGGAGAAVECGDLGRIGRARSVGARCQLDKRQLARRRLNLNAAVARLVQKPRQRRPNFQPCLGIDVPVRRPEFDADVAIAARAGPRPQVDAYRPGDAKLAVDFHRAAADDEAVPETMTRGRISVDQNAGRDRSAFLNAATPQCRAVIPDRPARSFGELQEVVVLIRNISSLVGDVLTKGFQPDHVAAIGEPRPAGEGEIAGAGLAGAVGVDVWHLAFTRIPDPAGDGRHADHACELVVRRCREHGEVVVVVGR